MYFIWAYGLGAINRIINMKIKNYDKVAIINAGIFQIFLSIWAGYNIYNGTNKTNYLIDDAVLGYYIYDCISLFFTSYNKLPYFIHHIVAIYIIYLNNTYKFSPFMYINLMYFLMELSAGMLNWMTLIDIYKTNYKFKVLTYSTYGILRCVIYPISIINYVKTTYQSIWYYNVHLTLLCLLFIMSMSYFIISVYELKSKII
jgi:hypothetical protein